MIKMLSSLVLGCLIFAGSTSSAQIVCRTDSFDGSEKVYSVQENVGGVASLSLIKINEKNSIRFQVDVATDRLKKYNFSKEYAEIKINDAVYKMNIIRTREYKETDYGLYPIYSRSELSSEAVEALKSAQKVVLRYHRENGYQDLIEVPDSVLVEWKQVIATEK